MSFFCKIELECNEIASIFLMLSSGHTKIANVEQLWSQVQPLIVKREQKKLRW